MSRPLKMYKTGAVEAGELHYLKGMMAAAGHDRASEAIEDFLADLHAGRYESRLFRYFCLGLQVAGVIEVEDLDDIDKLIAEQHGPCY